MQTSNVKLFVLPLIFRFFFFLDFISIFQSQLLRFAFPSSPILVSTRWHLLHRAKSIAGELFASPIPPIRSPRIFSLIFIKAFVGLARRKIWLWASHFYSLEVNWCSHQTRSWQSNKVVIMKPFIFVLVLEIWFNAIIHVLITPDGASVATIINQQGLDYQLESSIDWIYSWHWRLCTNRNAAVPKSSLARWRISWKFRCLRSSASR